MIIFGRRWKVRLNDTWEATWYSEGKPREGILEERSEYIIFLGEDGKVHSHNFCDLYELEEPNRHILFEWVEEA